MNAQLSPKAYKELNEKLQHMKIVRRKELSKAVGEAREHGDLRENSAYHEAKKEQGLNEMRIRELEASLAGAEVVERKTPKDTVDFGSKVKLKNLDNDRIVEYTLVSELEADIFENKISTDSPLGDALFGEKVNSVIEFQAPKGMVKYKILKIS